MRRREAEVVSIRRMQPLLGTWVEIRARGRAGRVERAVRSAFLHIARAQRRMSFHDPDSTLSRINLCAHHSAQQVDVWTWDVLRKALHLARASDGFFDVTVGARLVACGALPDHGYASLHAPIGSDAVELLPGRRVRLHRPVVLTLDGIAKGYAVDLATACLQRAGVHQAVVNAGGDLRVFGPEPVPIAVRNAHGALNDAGQLFNAAVASSIVAPDAQQRQRFTARLIHPKGHAVPSIPQIWTVRADQAWLADALTKVAALAKPGQRAAWVARLGGHLMTPEDATGLEAAA